MNKRTFISIICLFAISISSCAQVKKVYAYKQASIPGNIIASDDNDIKEKNEAKQPARKQNFNYWFYLSTPKKEKVIVTGLWIDNQQYDIKSDTITTLPVKKIIFTGLEKNDTTIMVPATSNRILLIYPGSSRTNDSKKGLTLAKTNELVIRYTYKGKTYYTTIRKIKELTPDVRV